MALFKRRSALFHASIALFAAVVAVFLYHRLGHGTVNHTFGTFFAIGTSSTQPWNYLLSALPFLAAFLVLLLVVVALFNAVRTYPTLGRAAITTLLTELFLIVLCVMMVLTPLTQKNIDVNFVGMARSPDEVYENSSFNVSVNLDEDLRKQIALRSAGVSSIPRHDRSDVEVGIDDATPKDRIEAELPAPGVTIAGDAKQQVSLSLGSLNYRWLCRVGDSGNYAMTFDFRLVRPGTDPINLGTVEREIRVNSLFHVPKWIVQLVGGLAAVFGLFQGYVAVVKWWTERKPKSSSVTTVN
jgi:hypothetical protein